jgi:hypothetical protein
VRCRTNEGVIRGWAHHLSVRAACLAARLMKVVATMRRFGLSECEQDRVWELWGEGTPLRGWRAQAQRPARVRASLCCLDRRGQAAAAEAFCAVPV